MAGGYRAEDIIDIKSATGMSTGDILYCSATRLFYEYDSTSTETEFLPWVITSNSAGIWSATGKHERISPIIDANTVTPNYLLSKNFSLIMTSSRTSRLIAKPTALIDGLPITIILKQPSTPPTGGCKITLAAAWKVTGNNFAINPIANSYSLLQGIYYQADDVILANITPI